VCRTKKRRKSRFFDPNWCVLCKKVAHPSREVAEQERDRMKQVYGREARNLHVYDCGMGHWHIGRIRLPKPEKV
jgi:hypothetical protein